jgi:predicted nucleotidyltransferase
MSQIALVHDNVVQNQTIIDLLLELENKHNINILYAVEAGSRAWGLDSDASDYDIRFIYVKKNVKEYFGLKKYTDSLTGKFDNDLYDWHGWDIKKALVHLKESNCSMIEWLNSPIIYIDTDGFADSLKDIANKMHSQHSLIHHYRSMAYSNWKIHMADKDIVNCKKYFYVIRPIIIVQWLMENKDIKGVNLLVDFEETLGKIRSNIKDETLVELDKLFKLKKAVNKLGMCPRIGPIDSWIMEIFDRYDKFNNGNSSKPESYTAQALISWYAKVQNENKKIINLSKNEYISRDDYLSVIGIGMQFEWLHQNPNKVASDIPTTIANLLMSIKLDDDVMEQVKVIIETKNQKEINEENEKKILAQRDNIMNDLIYNGLLTFLWKLKNPDSEIPRHASLGEGNEGVSLLPSRSKLLDNVYVSEQMKTAILGIESGKLVRDDVLTYIIRNTMNLMWIFNSNDSFRDAPSNIVMSDCIHPELRTKLTELISSQKPAYVVPVNPVINKWLQNMVTSYAEVIDDKKKELLKIRDINTNIRLKNSLNNVDESEFDDIFFKIVNLKF